MLPKGLLKEYAKPLAVLLRALDATAILLAGWWAFYLRFNVSHLSVPYLTAIMIAVLMVLIIFPIFRIYESIRATGFWRHLKYVMEAVAVVYILLALLAFLTKSGATYSRSWFLLWISLTLFLLMLFRGSMLFVLRLMRQQGWNERRVIIIGTGELSLKLVQAVQHAYWTGFRVVALFSEEPAAECPTPSNLSAYIANAKATIDEVWIALPLQAETRVKEIIHELRHETVTTRFILDIFGLDLFSRGLTQVAGFPALNIRTTPMIGLNRAIKALEDRALASLILLLISPLLLIIALGIKFTSKGPILYKQKRVGWNGKEFEMLKFRSMPVDAEEATGPVWAKQGESRATKMGAILRRTSLDELPQFINVLRGEMSIVGPRPERLIFVEQFKDQIPGYMQKHVVKAGITGWAQVNGWRGNTDLQKRIEYDLFYIENWSFVFDIKIIILTLFRGFLNKHAY